MLGKGLRERESKVRGLIEKEILSKGERESKGLKEKFSRRRAIFLIYCIGRKGGQVK